MAVQAFIRLIRVACEKKHHIILMHFHPLLRDSLPFLKNSIGLEAKDYKEQDIFVGIVKCVSGAHTISKRPLVDVCVIFSSIGAMVQDWMQ